MKHEFRFRLNGIIIPEIRIGRELIDGQPIGDLCISVCDDALGWFTIDDNSRLPDKSLTQFILEYRDETLWAEMDCLGRQRDKQKGWKRVSPQKLLKVLETAGVIR